MTKSGRTTQTTFGVVDRVGLTESPIVPDPTRPAPGRDSGSV
ncbi:hypothetical protein [Nonomuraea aridisoli]|nr:hypothetical protein [Nonomuraea aridisoli]